MSMTQIPQTRVYLRECKIFLMFILEQVVNILHSLSVTDLTFADFCQYLAEI